MLARAFGGLEAPVPVPPPVPVLAAPIAAGRDVLTEWVLNDSNITKAATVLTMASAARRTCGSLRTVEPGLQNAKLSTWIWRRGTPASRSALTTDCVMPSGPHT